VGYGSEFCRGQISAGSRSIGKSMPFISHIKGDFSIDSDAGLRILGFVERRSEYGIISSIKAAVSVFFLCHRTARYAHDII